MLDARAIAPERLRPLLRSEYDRLVEWGVFDGERLELLEGALVVMSPQHSPHAEVIGRLTELFVEALGKRARIRVQLPLAISDDSEPEPDIAVVARRDYSKAHPRTAKLIIEVADSSVRKDRTVKSSIYARASIPEYWLVNLVSKVVEVRTEPKGSRYTHVERRTTGTLSPRAFTDIAVPVRWMLLLES